jgi:hypothetical protein
MKMNFIKMIGLLVFCYLHNYGQATSYFPLELSNQWVYINGLDTTKETIVEKIVIGGREYFKFNSYRIGQDVLFRSMGDSIFSFFNSTEYLIYDFSAGIGESWIAQDVNSHESGTVTLLSKTDTIATPSGVYYNCIKLHHFLGVDYAYDEWFAPDIGVVRRDYIFFGFSSIRLYSFDIVLSIQSGNSPSIALKLHKNYPNPFNPSTIIKYDLPNTSEVVLRIYNTLGQEVATLINEAQIAGEKLVVWNGSDRFGNQVSSGIYIYRLEAGDFVKSRKMVLLK